MNESPKSVVIQIDSAAILKVILWLIFFVVLYWLRDLLLVILTSVVIASAIEPATRWLGRYRIPRTPAVLLVYLLVFGFIIALFPVFIIPVFNELKIVANALPEKIKSLSIFLDSPNSFLSFSGRVPFEEIYSNIQHTLAGFSKGFFEAASYFFGGFFSFVLIIVISFYLAVQEDGIANFLRVVVPLRFERYVVDLWKRSHKKIGLWLQGQLLLGLLVGVIVYLGLTILGIRYALVLSILAAAFELIPVFGPILAAVPAVLLGFSVSPNVGLMAIGFYIIVQQFENHLLYPLVVKKIVGVPSLVVILALIVGARLAGFLGVLLSVPLAAVLMEFVNDWENRKRLAPGQ